jgi:cytochrome b pre-mRNA-processing protein 3
MVLATLKRLFLPDPAHYRAHEAYASLVSQARQAIFYREWQVEDTLDGRFDVILLHLYLLIARCEKEVNNSEAPLFIRALSEIFFADMDRSLREMGVGDTGVGKRIKNMVQAFYGRLKAYRETPTLSEALKRNLYRERPVAEESLAAFTSYVERNRQALAAQPIHALMQGHIHFTLDQ